MRYLCTNPDCGKFATLIAGSQQTCPACGQRVLDEKVMLKRGNSLQAIIASKGRAVRAPAPAPRQDESILDPPMWREERDLAPRRPYEETKALFTKEQLTEELANGSIKRISQKHHIGMNTGIRLLKDFGIENLRTRGQHLEASAKEGAPVAEMMPESLAPTAAAANALASSAAAAADAARRLARVGHQAAEQWLDPRDEPKKPDPDPPAKTNATDGLRIQITRAGKAADVITRDLNTVLGSLEYRSPETPFNLTVILEEAAG